MFNITRFAVLVLMLCSLAQAHREEFKKNDTPSLFALHLTGKWQNYVHGKVVGADGKVIPESNYNRIPIGSFFEIDDTFLRHHPASTVAQIGTKPSDGKPNAATTSNESTVFEKTFPQEQNGSSASDFGVSGVAVPTYQIDPEKQSGYESCFQDPMLYFLTLVGTLIMYFVCTWEKSELHWHRRTIIGLKGDLSGSNSFRKFKLGSRICLAYMKIWEYLIYQWCRNLEIRSTIGLLFHRQPRFVTKIFPKSRPD